MQLYILQAGYKPGKDLYDLDAFSGATNKYKVETKLMVCLCGGEEIMFALSVFSGCVVGQEAPGLQLSHLVKAWEST